MGYSIASIGARVEQLKKQKAKKRGGYLIIELAFWFVVMAIIAAIALGLLGNTDGAKVTAANQELDQIRTALLSYRTYKITGTYPTELKDLFSTFDKSEAIDGRPHGPFLDINSSSRWSNTGDVTDPWGNQYEINGNVIKSTAGTPGDTTDDIVVTLQEADQHT